MNLRPSTALVLALGAFVLLTGMVRVDATNARYVSKKGLYSVVLPIGWVRDDSGALVAATRDGFNLHRITAKRVDLKDAFKPVLAKESKAAGEKERRRLTPDMPVEELAALAIAELKAGNEAAVVVGNEPALVAGQPAYNLTVEIKNDRGLTLRIESYGLVTADGFYELAYVAPALHFAARDQATFHAFRDSFAFVEGKGKKKR